MAVALLTLAISGCTYVSSAQGGNTAQTNEAWFTENTGLPGLAFSTRVFYCPPMGSGGAATCTEAEYVENAPAAAGGAAPAPAPAPSPAPAPAPTPAPDEGGGE
jgi:hypothetical protein